MQINKAKDFKASRVNIERIAELAGVSRSTASRAFGERGRINEKTRKRVLEIANQLGYRPHRAASALASGKTGVIGLALPIIDTPYMGELIVEFERTARNTDYHVEFYSLDRDAEVAVDHINLLGRARRVDALIIVPLPNEQIERSLVYLVQTGLPVVSLTRTGHLGIPFVVNDFEKGGYLATKHLLELGHTNIGFMAGPPPAAGGWTGRLFGYRRAMAEAKLPACEEGIRYSAHDWGDIWRAAADLLEKRRPTAVFCLNDWFAMIVWEVARQKGLRVPEDLSLVGYDKMQTFGFVNLTTVTNDPVVSARRAIAKALDLIDSGMPSSHEEMGEFIEPELLDGGTTAPPGG